MSEEGILVGTIKGQGQGSSGDGELKWGQGPPYYHSPMMATFTFLFPRQMGSQEKMLKIKAICKMTF